MSQRSSKLQPVAPSALFDNIVTELKTPLLEVTLEANRLGNAELHTLAKHALDTYEGYLLLRQLQAGGPADMLPCSLVAETEDALHYMQGLADLYSVELQIRTTKMRSPVALNRRIYQHATKGALYAVIASLQNSPGSKLQVTVSGKNGPSVSIFSPDIQVLAEDIAMASSTGRQRPSPLVGGAISGLVLAGQLYAYMGSGLQATSNQHGKGFLAGFHPSTQMSLIEAL